MVHRNINAATPRDSVTTGHTPDRGHAGTPAAMEHCLVCGGKLDTGFRCVGCTLVMVMSESNELLGEILTLRTEMSAVLNEVRNIRAILDEIDDGTDIVEH